MLIKFNDHDPRAGTVHVHFPRIGYVLKEVSP